MIKSKYSLLVLCLLALQVFIAGCSKDEQVNIASSFEVPATSDIVMYEVNIRAFSASHDFDGVTEKMDHIHSLGVNTIWLMPIYPVGQLNSVGQLGSPYAVADYTAVNPEFGTMQDFKELIAAAHENGIAVIVDWVANHTAWDNPWIENTDWYTQDEFGNIISPAGTNWNDVADLNFDNDEMRLTMIDALSFWVDEGVDGFRCDAADFVPYSFWKQAIDSLTKRHEQPLILLAEGARADHFNAGFAMNYSWNFYGTLKNVMNNNGSVVSLFNTHESETGSLLPGTQKLRFTTNHDETAWDESPPDLFGGQDAAFAAFVFTITIGGVPLIYGSQEVGTDFNVPIFSQSEINWQANPDILEKYAELLNIYKEQDALRYGSLTWHETGYHVAAYSRKYEQDEILVLVNPRDVSLSANLPEDIQGSWISLLNGNSTVLEATISLDPHEYILLKK